MMVYGTNLSGNTVISYDGCNFKCVDTPDGDKVFIGNDLMRAIGCVYLSGRISDTLVVQSDNGFEKYYYIRCFGYGNNFQWEAYELGVNQAESFVGLNLNFICMCGSDVFNSKLVRDFCKKHSSYGVYICPIVSELSSLGAIVFGLGLRATRINPTQILVGTLNFESLPFANDIEDDYLGQMADLVSRGFPVVNLSKSRLGVSPFYGNVLHAGSSGSSCVIVRRVEVEELFPYELVSIRDYASTSVWVQMLAGNEFKEKTGYLNDTVNVFVSTDYDEDVAKFMRFYKTLSGNGFVFVSDFVSKEYNGIVPVFRFDRMYRLKRDEYGKHIKVLQRK